MSGTIPLISIHYQQLSIAVTSSSYPSTLSVASRPASTLLSTSTLNTPSRWYLLIISSYGCHMFPAGHSPECIGHTVGCPLFWAEPLLETNLLSNVPSPSSSAHLHTIVFSFHQFLDWTAGTRVFIMSWIAIITVFQTAILRQTASWTANILSGEVFYIFIKKLIVESFESAVQ